MTRRFILFVFLLGMMSILAYSATETLREGICGDRIAQVGADPECEPSQATCYVKIYYDDGTTGEAKMAVWEPATQLGYGDIRNVDVWSSPTGVYHYKINLYSYSYTFNAPTELVVHTWIANQP